MDLKRFKQTYYNGGKVFAKSLLSRVTGKRIPIFSTIYITDVCNQRCAHCGIHTVNTPTAEFSTGELIGVIDELCDMGAEWFRLLGGEPLLRRDLPEIVDHVSLRRGKIAEIVTNGLGLEDHLERLRNLQFIGIIMEGDRENHERVRGPGSFDPAVEAVEVAVAAGKFVRIHMVLNRYNMQPDNIDFMVDFCGRHKVKFDFCRPMINPYHEQEIPDYYLVSDAEAMAFYRTILHRKRTEDIPISNSTRSIERLLQWPFSHDKYTLFKRELADLAAPFEVPECTSGITAFELSSDGKLRLCVNRYDGEIDIREAGGIREAWKQMADKDCYQCAHLSCIELALMLNVDPVSVVNAVKLLGR